MGCMRLKSFLLVILLFFAALGDSFADAHHAIEMVDRNSKATGGDKVFLDETRAATTTKGKWLRGRKMGAKEQVEKKHEVEAKGPMNTGKPRNSSKKSLRSSRVNIHDKDDMEWSPSLTVNMDSKGSSHGSVKQSSNQEHYPQAFVASSTHGSLGLPPGGTLSASHGSHDQFQTIDVQKHQDAVTQMFNMLNKDYATKAHRKPPINNDIPLEDLDVEP